MSSAMLDFQGEQPHFGASPAWAHMVGAVSLPPAPLAPEPRSRETIRESISRFFWALDERRADILEGLLGIDATWEGGVGVEHRIGPFSGREPIMEWLRKGWALDTGQCRHLALNTTFLEAKLDRTVTASYLLLCESAQDVFAARSSGFVRIDHRCREGEWTIDRLFVGWDAPPWRQNPSSPPASWQRTRFGVQEEESDVG